MKRYEHRRKRPALSEVFSTTSLAEVMHTLHCEELSGILTVKHENIEKIIYILEGKPAFVESDLRSETLGAYLLKIGRIDEVQHRMVVERMRQTGRRQGELFLDEGILSPHELFEQLLGHVTEKIITCFAWQSGAYSFTEGDQWSVHVINLKIEPSRLILDGINRYYDRDRLGPLSAISEDAQVYLRSDAPKSTANLQLTTTEARLYDLVSQSLSIQEIERTPGWNPATTRTSLYGLYLLEIIGLEENHTKRNSGIPQHTPIPIRISMPAQKSPPQEKHVEKLIVEYLMLKEADHFTLLGVDRKANTKEIRAAFRQLSERFSPKATKDLPAEVQEKAHELYQKFLQAYRDLTNKTQRSLYLKKLEQAEVRRVSSLPPKSLESDELLAAAKKDLEEGRHVAAVDKLQKAMEIKPSEPLYETHYAWALFISDPTKNRKKAEVRLEMTRRSQPEMPEPYLFMARIFENDGANSRALRLYAQARERGRNREEIMKEVHLAEIRLSKNQGRTGKSSLGARGKPTGGDQADSALNMDVGQLIRGLFSKNK